LGALIEMVSTGKAPLSARASDPKVNCPFGIDPMLTPLSGVSIGAENRIRFSARCAKTQ